MIDGDQWPLNTRAQGIVAVSGNWPSALYQVRPRRYTHSMRKCFLNGYGPCGGKLTGEHYISRTVLEAMGSDTKIGGLRWQPEQTLQSIGIGSLVAKILCETHNSGLSDLDTCAGKLFRAIDAADKRFPGLLDVTKIDGPTIERWFLKVIAGLAAGMGLNNDVVPEVWKQVLRGGIWPKGWGLYVPSPSGSTVLATEFAFDSLVNPVTSEILAAKFRVAGVHFNLLLGAPDNPDAWGAFRPRGLIFQSNYYEKRVEFIWPIQRNLAVIYSKVAVGSERAPQWGDWKD